MKHGLLFSFLIVLNSTYSQQLRFTNPIEGSQIYFNSRFELTKNGDMEFLNTKLLKQHKVSKAYFYYENQNIFCVMEFDSNGTLSGKGYQERYYFSEKRWRTEGTKNIEMISWYRDTLLMRSDMLVWETMNYHQADTDMVYTKSHLCIYLRGELLNERNDYYNRSYREIIDQNFERNYDPLQLYFASDRHYTGELKATAFNGKINLDTTYLSSVSFYKDFCAAHQFKAFVEGEDFIEPASHPPLRCGNETPPAELRMRETYNKAGLLEAVYSSPIENENDEVLYCKVRYDYYK